MLIKLNKVFDDKLNNKYKIVRFHGTRLDNGEEWNKQFIFANKKDLVDKLNDFSPGDEVNVVLQHVRDRIYNVVDFKEVTEEDKASLERPKGNIQRNTRRPDGGSRGDDTNRSAAIYLSKDLVTATKTETQLHKLSPADLLNEILAVAEMVNEYIKEGTLPPPDYPFEEDTDRALEPPEVD